MAYEEALAAAGATVHKFESFGSYQGDWWAHVTLADGRTGWIRGSYGSCSGCDAFDAEFGYDEREKCDEHDYRTGEEWRTCEQCAAKAAAYQQHLSEFGAGYLDGLLTQEDAEKRASEDLEWDCDAQEMVDFVRSALPGTVDAVDPVDGDSNG